MFELRYYCYSSERWEAINAVELPVRWLHSIIFYVKHTAHAWQKAEIFHENIYQAPVAAITSVAWYVITTQMEIALSLHADSTGVATLTFR